MKDTKTREDIERELLSVITPETPDDRFFLHAIIEHIYGADQHTKQTVGDAAGHLAKTLEEIKSLRKELKEKEWSLRATFKNHRDSWLDEW